MERGCDRRTVQRRLLAAGLKPHTIKGAARFYAVQDMDVLMFEEDNVKALRALDAHSQSLIHALDFLSQFLPDSMDRALKHCNISLAKREVATIRLWACLAQVVANALPHNPAGVPIPESAAIREIAVRHGISLHPSNAETLIN